MSETFTTPIRLLFGMGNNFFQGFSALYEKANGTSGVINIWYPTTDNENTLFQCIKFIDAPEESCIVWCNIEENVGVFGSKKTIKRKIVEIRLRRDWQFKS